MPKAYLFIFILGTALISCEEKKGNNDFIDTAVRVIDTTILKDPSDTLEGYDSSPARDLNLER